ncbi:MAG TPA: hypothetical protein PKE29_09695 [Phycisphaerales bacterium]|nr:hypothetical protein [Phycisphaerales bacterium]
MTDTPTFLSPRSRLAWRAAQTAAFAAGIGIVVALLVWPRVGLALLWNVLVPVAPALLVVAPGLWRNVCPLGSTALWSRHMGLSARRKLSPNMQGWFALVGLILLLVIVPLRHVVLNTHGPVTGSILIAVGVLSILMGMAFEWKSGWCSGLCPVHPVEKLYGVRPAVSVRNAHCTECHRCTAVCPDSTRGMNPLFAPRTRGHAITGAVLVGGFPGYVWGWFQVSDSVGTHARAIGEAYALPFLGLAATLLVYLCLRKALARRHRDILVRCFAAAAVSCYYWFRLPMLVGYGPFPGEGTLVDLRATLPAWAPMGLQIAAAAFFVWWMVLRSAPKRAWTLRPPFASGVAPTP